MKKILVLIAIIAAIFTVSSCEKATEDSWKATVETLDPTNVTFESACLNAKITWSCTKKHLCEVGILYNTEPGVKYYTPGVISIRKDNISQQEGVMELHETIKHLETTPDTYYYVAYFRIFIGPEEKFIYGKEVSYKVPGK